MSEEIARLAKRLRELSEDHSGRSVDGMGGISYDLHLFMLRTGRPSDADRVADLLESLASENERLREEKSKMGFQLDSATKAIGYAIEAIDADGVSSAYLRLSDAQETIENADAHKAEWETYR